MRNTLRIKVLRIKVLDGEQKLALYFNKRLQYGSFAWESRYRPSLTFRLPRTEIRKTSGSARLRIPGRFTVMSVERRTPLFWGFEKGVSIWFATSRFPLCFASVWGAWIETGRMRCTQDRTRGFSPIYFLSTPSAHSRWSSSCGVHTSSIAITSASPSSA